MRHLLDVNVWVALLDEAHVFHAQALAFIERQVAAVEAENDKRLADWQTKSLEERGAGVISCCRSAAATMTARLQMGIGPTPREPWSAAIWEMLRKQAADARNHPYDAP